MIPQSSLKNPKWCEKVHKFKLSYGGHVGPKRTVKRIKSKSPNVVYEIRPKAIQRETKKKIEGKSVLNRKRKE